MQGKIFVPILLQNSKHFCQKIFTFLFVVNSTCINGQMEIHVLCNRKTLGYVSRKNFGDNMDITKCAALILAAGKGTRMHSMKPKVMQTILGTPMFSYVDLALQPVFDDKIFVVAGHGAENIARAFPDIKIVMQKEQLGTGHALLCAMPELYKYEYVLVVNGDAPLIPNSVVTDFIDRADGCDVAFASIELDDAGSYGRVVRKNGLVTGIVEAKDLETNARENREVNAGIYFLRIKAIEELLPQLGNNNKSGEYYITDLVGLGVARGMDVRAIKCGKDENLLGVNSPAELCRIEEILRRRTVQKFLNAGVIMHAPDLVRISPLASIEAGAEICGPCEIYGHSEIKSGVFVGSNTVVISSKIFENAQIRAFSHLEEAIVCQNAQVGPYTRLRPQAVVGEDAHAGNFVELKKTTLGKGAKANHLTYLGDTEIGSNTNIGAGTITCNYDGKHKYKTKIGDSAFIGSNTSLVAPVNVGDNALIGAGSVITRNVPENELGIGRARQKNLPKKIK